VTIPVTVDVPRQRSPRLRKSTALAAATTTASATQSTALCPVGGPPHVTLLVLCENARSIVTHADPWEPIPRGQLAMCTVFVSACGIGNLMLRELQAWNQVCNLVTGTCVSPPVGQDYRANLLWKLAPLPLEMPIMGGYAWFNAYPFPVPDALVLGANEVYADRVTLRADCLEATCGVGTEYYAAIEVAPWVAP